MVIGQILHLTVGESLLPDNAKQTIGKKIAYQKYSARPTGILLLN